MNLFLFRHAAAAERGPRWPDDAERPLTERGRERFGAVVAALGDLRVRFDRVLHSPLLRATQTAELLYPALRGDSEVTTLLAEAPTEQLLGEFTHDCVAVVGHEPWLSELAAWLLTGRRDGPGFVVFKKGAFVWLEGQPTPGAMRLKAMLTPKLARRLRG